MTYDYNLKIIILLIAFGCLALAKGFSFKQFTAYPKILINKQLVIRLIEDNSVFSGFYLSIGTSYILLMGLFLELFFVNVYNMQFPLVYYWSFVLSFLVIKSCIDLLLGSILEFYNISQLFVKHRLYLNFALSFVLLIVVSLLLFLQIESINWYWISLLMLIALHLACYIIVIMSFLTVVIPNFFYFILYICALEIAPLFMVYAIYLNGL